MRGIYTSINEQRKAVYAEVAKLSYEYEDGDLSQMDKIPYDKEIIHVTHILNCI